MVWLRGLAWARDGHGKEAPPTQPLLCGEAVPTQPLTPCNGAPEKNEVSGGSIGLSSFSIGTVVEYNSTSRGWMLSRVRAVNEDGSYDLDCKPCVKPERLRMSTRRRNMSDKKLELLTEFEYDVGDRVEYFSASLEKWILAEVLNANQSGTYDLTCKPDVLPAKMRRPSEIFKSQYYVGEVVEYRSSQLGWIHAKVLAVNQDGSYKLDCKQDAQASQVRKRLTNVECRQQCSLKEATQKDIPASTSGSPRKGSLFSLFNWSSRWRQQNNEQLHCDVDSNVFEGPVQLVSAKQNVFGHWSYEVCADASRRLERYGARRVSVIALCGPPKSGKSSLLRMMLAPDTNSDVCKESSVSTGISMWIAADAGDRHSPLVVFLDCGACDQPFDAQLLALSNQMSSVLVMNTKGELGDAAFLKVSRLLDFKNKLNSSKVDCPRDRPALYWLLRDFELELRDAGGRPVLPEEYLEQALQGTPKMKQDLLQYFGQRMCITLPKPCADEMLQSHGLEGMTTCSLRREFITGVDALRTQLFAVARSNPKSINGRPLGCRSFMALTEHMISTLNTARAFSLIEQWDEVQHKTCSHSVEALRSSFVEEIQALASGQTLQGGASLPMPDDALQAVLRDQRHMLKAAWMDSAVGDEEVRKQHWEEFKGFVVLKQTSVVRQNIALSDRHLIAAGKRWQEWLESDNHETSSTGAATQDLLRLMEQVPAAPVVRATRVAMEAAARHVVGARAAVAATLEQTATVRNRAVAWGKQAAEFENAARTEFEAYYAEHCKIIEELDQMAEAQEKQRGDIRTVDRELAVTRELLASAEQDLQTVRRTVRAISNEFQLKEEMLVPAREELKLLRAAYDEGAAEKLASDNLMAITAERASAEKARLEAELERLQKDCKQFADQCAQMQKGSENEHARMLEVLAQEVNALQQEHEKQHGMILADHQQTREDHLGKLSATRKELDEHRSLRKIAFEEEQARHVLREREIGVLEGKANALAAEKESLRKLEAELWRQIHEAENRSVAHAEEAQRLQASLQEASEVADTHAADLEAELAARAEAFEHQRRRVGLSTQRDAVGSEKRRWRLLRMFRRAGKLDRNTSGR